MPRRAGCCARHRPESRGTSDGPIGEHLHSPLALYILSPREALGPLGSSEGLSRLPVRDLSSKQLEASLGL
eukprot:4539514-Alexandrium_andersonii.AAC.1